MRGYGPDLSGDDGPPSFCADRSPSARQLPVDHSAFDDRRWIVVALSAPGTIDGFRPCEHWQRLSRPYCAHYLAWGERGAESRRIRKNLGRILTRQRFEWQFNITKIAHDGLISASISVFPWT